MSDLLENVRNPERAFNHETDDQDVVDFESYRELCDALDDFRKVGVQDEESYNAVLQDERTVFVEYGGSKMPLLAPLGYEKMYNEERCLAMTGKKQAMLLAVPFSHLEQMQLETLFAIDDDTVVIVEEFVPTDDSVKLDQHDVSKLPFTNVQPFDFKNPNLAAVPPHETAWMAAYGFHMEPTEGPSRTYEGGPLASDIMSKWKEVCAQEERPELPGDDSTGTFLLSAEQLAERPDIIEQLWDISQIGFGEILGADHPISMEFNKQFFNKQIVADNTITAVHCVDGEVACFSFVGLDMKNNEWLNENSTVLKNMTSEAESRGEASVHVHELIGRGRKGMGYATKILKTFFETISKTGYPYSVFFESTNMSSLYIPPLITRDIDRSETMAMTSDIQTLGKLSYWALVAQTPPLDLEGTANSYQET